MGRLRGDGRLVGPRGALEPRRARAAGAALLSGHERAGPGARRAEARPRGAGLADRIAILDTGAQAPGYDALDRDDDPSPGADVRSPARRETTGDALAQIVTAAGERTLTIRVAGYGANRQEIHGTTDTLLAGLERAVDPDGDGAVDDAVRVALVGVNAPYAAFADSAEAQAVRGAGKLGTLVVAPAGNEGPARPPNGVVGSPAAARTALAAGATEAGAGAPRVDVTIGGRELQGAAVLGGAPPAGDRAARRPGHEHRRLGAAARQPEPRRTASRSSAPGTNPTAQAAAAAGAGASAVLARRPPRPPAADAARRPLRRARDRR